MDTDKTELLFGDNKFYSIGSQDGSIQSDTEGYLMSPLNGLSSSPRTPTTATTTTRTTFMMTTDDVTSNGHLKPDSDVEVVNIHSQSKQRLKQEKCPPPPPSPPPLPRPSEDDRNNVKETSLVTDYVATATSTTLRVQIAKSALDTVAISSHQSVPRNRSRDYGILVLSALYAKLLIVLGISLPLSEIISPMIPTSFYVWFYLYLYFGCILFLLYAYLFLLRPTGTTSSIVQMFSRATKNDPLQQFGQQHHHLHIGPPLSCGSFYLRAGAIAFGIGSMIYSGLEFVQFFEFNPKSICYKLVYAVTPITQMTFTFVQLYFIFLNSKMRTYKYKNVARFGLMHMLGTNLCIWLFTVIMESKYEILRLADPSILQDSHHGVNGTNYDSEDDLDNYNYTLFHLSPMAEVGRYTRCRRRRVLGQLVQNISPLLFPCSIQYSLICAAICLIMWRNVRNYHHMPGTTCAVVKTNGTTTHYNGVPEYHLRQSHHYSVDCTGSIKGLFTGILLLVMVIISVILYFVLINKPEYRNLAILEAHLSEMSLYVLTTPVIIVTMWRIRGFRYQAQKNIELDNILLIFAQVGIYLFSIFSMIGGHLSPDGPSLMVFGTSMARIIQATVQTVFILDASNRTPRTSNQARLRPGRELIAFLLVCNFAMWIICTLETGRSDSHPVQLNFYGFWGWTIISRFCSPLSIFFRFHSTVCLCEIWKKLYKDKSERERTYSTLSYT